MVKRLYVMLCLVCLHLAAWAEVVTGTIRDAETGEALVGATIVAEGSSPGAKQGKQASQVGTATDAEGAYSLTLKAGKHVLTVRYLGYESSAKEVEVRGTTTLDFVLTPSTNLLQTAVVTAEAHRGTDNAVAREQQEALVVMTGVSQQQIKRTQDKNAGEVIRRIPGVSIIDDKFVMVRGLAQRYNNVWLNGAAVPSSEADQRAFSFDIVPSSQLADLKVVKSSAPEFPADFTGGFIMVNTKDVPTSNSWGLGLGTGLNTATHLQHHVRTAGGGAALPDINANWRTRTSMPLADLSLQGEVAQRWLTASGHTLGLTGSASFSNNYQSLRDMENNMFGAYDVTHQRSNYLRRTTDQQFNHSTRLGAMLSLVWLPASGKHRIELKQILNRLTRNRYTSRRGYDAQSDYMEQAEYYDQSRLTYNLGLSAKHALAEADKFNWNLGYAYANRNLPDRKRYSLYEQADGSLEIENLNDINREGSHLGEHILSGKADWEHAFSFGAWEPKLRVGGYGEHRRRAYTTQFFTYAWPKGQLPESLRQLDVPTELLTPEHYGPDGLYLIEQVDWSNNYAARGSLASGYAAAHLPLWHGRIEAYGGVRFEHSRTELIAHTRRQEPSPLSTYYTYNDFFPSLNITAHLTPTHQLRAAYGKTTNRPEFRELSTSVYYDFDLASNVQGNHHLLPAYIHNFDLGWEWYPHAGEVVSVSLFYKHFRNPIEWTYTVAGGTDLVYSYLNAEGATNYGIELDIRKQLDFIRLPQLSLSLNASWIMSKVQFPEGSKEVDRPMQGQSPYLINAGIFWNGDQGASCLKGWSAALLYNTIGRRLIGVGRSVGSGATEVRVPDSYEMPRHQLDLNLGKRLGCFDLHLSVRNILAQSVQFKQFEKTASGTIEQITRSYRPGTTLQLSVAFKMD